MKLELKMKQYITLILIGVISYWIVNNFDVIGNIISKIFHVLIPFVLGSAIAFILNIPMTKIEKNLNKKIKNKKVPIRVISIILSLFIFILIFIFILFLLIPEIIENIESLISNLPSLFNKIEIWIINLLDKYPDIQFEIEKIFASNNLENIIPSFLEQLINSAFKLISSLATGIINLFTAIVFSIYILSQKEYLLRGINKIIKAFTKPNTSEKIEKIGNLSARTFNNFISGQCVEAVILGIIFFVVLSITKFPYALIISVLTAITALIPIFGAMIAMIIGAILIAITNPIKAIIFIIIFQIIQQIENNFIYPRVVGKSVGLSPIWTLFSISVGGSLFGVIGMIIALPLASIFYALLKENVNERLKLKASINNKN